MNAQDDDDLITKEQLVDTINKVHLGIMESCTDTSGAKADDILESLVSLGADNEQFHLIMQRLVAKNFVNVNNNVFFITEHGVKELTKLQSKYKSSVPAAKKEIALWANQVRSSAT